MAQVLIHNSVGTNQNANITSYNVASTAGSSLFTTETNVQIKYNVAGTFSNHQVHVTTNTLSVTATHRLRINAANGNSSVSITSATTGIFEDTSNTDTISANDLVDFSFVTPAGSGGITVGNYGIIFDAASNNFLRLGGSNFGFSTASVTRYFALSGSGTPNTTESQAVTTIRGTFTGSNLSTYITSNARTSTTTYRTRKNTANGGMSVSVGSTATGLFEDNSNSDSLANTDTYCLSMTTSTSTGSIICRFVSVAISSSSKQYFATCGNVQTAAAVAQNVTTYFRLFGSLIASATENARRIRMRHTASASKLMARVTANTSDQTTTVRTRVNGANGNQSLSITTTATGLFEDTTNSDSLITTDYINYQVAVPAGAGSVSFVHMSMLMEDTTSTGQPIIKRRAEIPFLGGSLRTANF